MLFQTRRRIRMALQTVNVTAKFRRLDSGMLQFFAWYFATNKEEETMVRHCVTH